MMKAVELLHKQISELTQFISEYESKTSSVSGWSVLQHCEHICLVANGALVSLLRSSGDKTASKSLTKLAFFKTRFIPRGQFKAPSFVSPKDDSSADEVQKMISHFAHNVDEAVHAEENKTSKHPMLGILSKDETLNFVGIHTQHHIKIIRDIIAN